ncbi:cytidine deaminase [Bombilactobacillus folatiphilus]|uniref:Cytidine deaminase n=1 Tax=Bombilactobacillus folatiphilus TaxID=2923362 RepID=A0ABY4P750_9LACO|nr:cytidine deaminase [Bombilactobacillus folatiphilus]UQS81530.1 cytidine deaminase [Bombilactobacillus folatiphilus]
MKIDKLMNVATKMLDQAYAPYSHFHVGAALLTTDGQIFGGCNIENASYGLTNCAERTAIFQAVANGCQDFQALLITGQTGGPIAPCGACRQVISEFCDPQMPVILTNQAGAQQQVSVAQLLPGAFSTGDLADDK